MFQKFEEEARKALVVAKEEMFLLKHPYVGSEHLMLAILKDEKMGERLKDYGITYELFRDKLIAVIGVGSHPSDWFLHTPLLKRIIENATLTSKENNNGDVTIDHLLLALLDEGEGVAIRIMVAMNVKLETLYRDLSKKSVVKKNKKKNMVMDEISVDLTKKSENNEFDPVIGREDEIRRLIEILGRRTKNNPLLIGEAGVGKTAIVEGISDLIVKGLVPDFLKKKRILSVDMAGAVAGTKYRGEFEERIKKMILEVEENEDIILFIDEIHTLVGAGGAEGAIDASNIFKPALARGKIRCIGATTTSEYKKHIEHDAALDRRFQKIFVEAPSLDKMKEIIRGLRPIYEDFHRVKISDEMIELLIKLSDEYIHDRHQPDKTIDILDEVCSKVAITKNKPKECIVSLKKHLMELIDEKNDLIVHNSFDGAYVLRKEEERLTKDIERIHQTINKDVNEITEYDIAEIIHEKTKIPLYEILGDNGEQCDRIAHQLAETIIGQEEAVKQLLTIVKRMKVGQMAKRKCASYLFSGPSGVGKTLLAKAFGASLVGIDNVIKMDMSEYCESHHVNKIIGSPPGYVGYEDHHTLLEQIRNKPNCVLILDEMEKAHPTILNLFLSILDDSVIRDASGRDVRFDRVVIIMTTNVGSQKMGIGFDQGEQKYINKLKSEFKTELINRIHYLIPFNKLTREDILLIIHHKLEKLAKRFCDISISWCENVEKEIVELSNWTEFGARKVDKIIEEWIELIIVEAILSGEKSLKIESIKEPAK